MKHRTSIGDALIALLLFAATNNYSTAEPKQALPPPSMSKLAEPIVMAPLPDDRLIAVLDSTGPEGQEAIARYSSDGGRTWSEPDTLFALPKDMGRWGLHNVLADHQGELHLFYQSDAKTAGKGLYEMRFNIYHVGSTNGRKSWKPPVLVREGYNGSMLSVIELKSGRIILPICYLTPRIWSNRGEGFDAFTDMGRFSSGVVYSDDGGDTWQQATVELKVPSPYIGADGIIEPIALELKDGRAWLLLRTQLGRFFESVFKGRRNLDQTDSDLDPLLRFTAQPHPAAGRSYCNALEQLPPVQLCPGRAPRAACRDLRGRWAHVARLSGSGAQSVRR